MAFVSASDKQMINVNLDPFNKLRVLPGLGHDKSTIMASPQAHGLSSGSLQGLLAIRAAVALAVWLDWGVLITTGQAPRLVDGRTCELNPVLFRHLIVEMLLN